MFEVRGVDIRFQGSLGWVMSIGVRIANVGTQPISISSIAGRNENGDLIGARLVIVGGVGYELPLRLEGRVEIVTDLTAYAFAPSRSQGLFLTDLFGKKWPISRKGSKVIRDCYKGILPGK